MGSFPHYWVREWNRKQTNKKYCVGLGKHLLEITQLKNPHKHIKSLWTHFLVFTIQTVLFLSVWLVSKSPHQTSNKNKGTIRVKFSLVSVLPDLWAHFKQPVDGLPQKSHVVVRRNVLKYGDLLREALGMEAKREISREHKYLHFLKWKNIYDAAESTNLGWERQVIVASTCAVQRHVCLFHPFTFYTNLQDHKKNRNMSRRLEVVLLFKWKLSCLPSHQVLQRVAHQFLLQSFHQSNLNGLRLILRLAVGAEPLRQNWTILRRRRRASQTIYREQYTLTGSSKTQQATTSQASTLLLSPVLRMGPCRGPGPGRNCTGGRWLPAGRRSYRGRGTERPPRTLPRPPDAGGLSSACSPGSTRWSPATEPERMHEEDSQRLLNTFQEG